MKKTILSSSLNVYKNDSIINNEMRNYYETSISYTYTFHKGDTLKIWGGTQTVNGLDLDTYIKVYSNNVLVIDKYIPNNQPQTEEIIYIFK